LPEVELCLPDPSILTGIPSGVDLSKQR
jgi:hypothetical protein